MNKIKVNWSIQVFSVLCLVLICPDFSYSQQHKTADHFLTRPWKVGDTWITQSVTLNPFHSKMDGWSIPVLTEYKIVGKNKIQNIDCFIVEKRPYPPTGEERQFLYFRSVDKRLVRQVEYHYLQGLLQTSKGDFPIINSTPILKTEWLPDRLESIKNEELVLASDYSSRPLQDQVRFDQRGHYLSQAFQRIPIQDVVLKLSQDHGSPPEFLRPQNDSLIEAQFILGTPDQRLKNEIRSAKQYWSSEFPWFLYEELEVENSLVKKTWLIRYDPSIPSRERSIAEFPIDTSPFSFDQNNPMQFPLALDAIAETKTAPEPWAGWWWPLYDGTNPNLYDITGNWQPLKRYDDRVSPGQSLARDWEYNYDRLSSNDIYSGHCHAWAAASVKESKPSLDNGALTKGDLEGLLVECYDDVVDAFNYKYFTSSEDNIPMKPGDFLLALKETIGAASPRPIIMDLYTGDTYPPGSLDPKSTFPVYKYDLNCSLVNGRQYNCQTRIWFKIDTPMPGENGYQSKDMGSNLYSFTVEIQNGIPISGTGVWTSSQISPVGAGKNYPDLAWYPGSLKAHNPKVDCNTVKALIDLNYMDKSDFLITGMALIPAGPTANGTFSAQVTVKNQGTASGNGGRLEVWTDLASAPACGATGNQYVSVGALGAGQSQSYNFSNLGAGTAGAKTFRAFVDSACQTTESNEGNNQTTLSYTVDPPPQPDLVVSSISLTPARPTANGTFTAQVTVKNQGAGSAGANRLEVWTDLASVPACGAVGIQYVDVGALGAGQSQSYNFSNLGAGTAGAKTFRAFVDSACQTTESNEGNNQTTLSYTVDPPPQPDLVVSSISLTPARPTANGTFTAQVTVKNQGAGSAGANRLEVWTDLASVPACGAVGIQYVDVGALGAGQSQSYNFSNLGAGTAGTKTFRAFVDSACQTTESNEGNNQTTLSYTVDPPPQPDLVVTAITLNPAGPTANGTFSAQVTVKNQGTVSADGGRLEVWTDQAAAPACGATGNQYVSVGALGAGQSQSFNFNNLGAGAAGTKTFRAFVDSACQTTESIEANNQSGLSYTVDPPGQPDLVVSAISLSPANPIADGTFSAQVTVKNQGTVSADGGRLEVWTDQVAAPACGASGNQFVSVGTLGAGQSQSFNFNNLGAGAAGTKTFRAYVDSACQTTESIEGNNQSSLSYTVNPPGQPDLVVTAISLSPTNPTADGTFSAQVTVKNQGTASGNGGRLEVWTDLPSLPACGATGNQYFDVGPLESGQSKTFPFNNLGAGAAGTKTFRAFVDSLCQTTESNEGNNQSSLSFTVNAAGQPDLVVTGITLNPGSPTANGTFSAQVTVKNQGTASGNGGRLEVWTDLPAAPACGAAGTQNTSVGTLAAGESKSFFFSSLGAGAAGTKTFRAFVDSLCQTTESGEGNNQSSLSFTVSAAGQPDLVVTAISLNPANPTANGTFSAEVTVKNQGTASGNGGRLEVWTDLPSAPACGATGIQYFDVGSLELGQSKTFPFNNLNAGAAGTKTFRAFVDSACQTTESSESNNQSSLGFTVSAAGQPDLVVAEITLNPGSPTANGNFSAEVTVKNQGTASGNGGRLEVWTDLPSAPACGADGNQNTSVGTLAAGESKTFPFSSLEAGAAGTKTFRAFVDSGCETTESSENNNQSSLSFTVSAMSQPDLVVTGIVLSPANPTANGTFSAEVTVTNQGTASGNGGRLEVWTDLPAPPACGTPGNQYVSVGDLGAGQSRTFTLSSLGAGAAGTKTFRAFVDSLCQTTETNEDNNQSSQSYTVSAAGQPDLVVAGITLSPANPTANETFSAQVTVKNQGTVSGNGGRLEVWADLTAAPACGAAGNQYVIVGDLGPEESRTFAFTNLGAGAAGTKTFRAFVDSLCQTMESREDNNQSSLSFTRIENPQNIFYLYLPVIRSHHTSGNAGGLKSTSPSKELDRKHVPGAG